MGRWRFILLVVVGFSAVHIQAQTVLPDSLAQLFTGLQQDSAYVNRLNALASDYLRFNPTLSRRIAVHAAEVAPGINFIRGYARSLTVIGNSYWSEGVFELAQNYYLMAVRQYESIEDETGLGQTYNNIGEVYKKMGDYNKALEYLTIALGYIKNDLTKRATTLYNIAELYMFMNDLTRASTYIDQSLSIAVNTNSRKVIGYNYNAMGIIYARQKKYQDAIDYLIRAEKIWKELGEMRLLIQTYQDMTDVQRELRAFGQAEIYLMLAMEMSSLIKVSDLQVINYYKLARLDSARGDYQGALAALYHHAALKDSVYNITKSEQIARLQTMFESENKERENQRLRSEKEFRESQLKLQRQIIYGISISLVLAGVMAWFLYRQRHKILSVNKILQEKNDEIGTQKLAIEMQATALIKLNEELQELNKHLEERIENRTRQLSHQNQKLTEYTFVNAHKLRAPVSSILGLINLIDQASPEEYSVIMNHLKTCGQQLDNITRELSRNLEDGIIDH